MQRPRRLPAVLLMASAAFAACGGEIKDQDRASVSACSPELRARAEAVWAASELLVELASELREQAATACLQVARNLGDSDVTDPGDPAQLTDEQLQLLCEAAGNAVQDRVSSVPGFSVEILGGDCGIAAEDQLACEATCLADPTCDLGTVGQRCPPGGEVAGGCSEPLEPSACGMDEVCQAGCEGLAALGAECADATVITTAPDDPDLAATLDANLPSLLEVQKRLELAAESSIGVFEALLQLDAALLDAPACADELDLDLETMLHEAQDATATLAAVADLFTTDHVPAA